MWNRILQIVRKEFLQTLREPRMRIILIVPPIIQLLIFGYAVNLDVDTARIAFSDTDRSPQSLDLMERFSGSGHFEIVARPQNEAEVQRVLDRGEAMAVVRVLPGFGRHVDRGETTSVQILVDGTNSNTASLVSAYAAQVVTAYSGAMLQRQINLRLMARGGGGPVNLAAPDVVAVPRVWFNPDLRSRNFFVPGVIVNIMMMVTLMLTALGIVREKEIGTMEQLMVTPIRPIELMLGKTLPYAVVGFFELVLITTVALLVFHIPFRGSPLLLLGAALLFLLTTLGAGLFLSTISDTQQQAMMASFFFSTPAFMLSGFTFPIHNMPEIVQWVTYLNPLRYFMDIVRGIFLKGTGFDVLWPQMLALAVYGVAVLTMSALRFHKRMD